MGHFICNGPSNPSFNCPYSHLVVLYIIYRYIYIQMYSKLVSAWVCRADFQVFFLMCFHSNMTPGADQSCCLRGSGWGTALAKPLAFSKRLVYLNCCFCFFCTLPCHKTIAVCGDSPRPDTSKVDSPIKRLVKSQELVVCRTDETKLIWP